MTEAAGYTGKRVIVVGAASGTGAATTQRLVEWGAEVHTIDRVKPDMRGLASFTECDLRDLDQIDAAVDKVGRYVHMLVICAPHGPGVEHLIDRVVADMLEGSTIICAGGPDAEEYVARRAPELAEQGIVLEYADPPFVSPEGERAD